MTEGLRLGGSMTLRALINISLILTLSSCRIVSEGSGHEKGGGAHAGGRVVNVREFGAKGDGVADDTGAIQSAVNAARPGETIYFSSGTYKVSNFAVKNRAGLSFAGEGRKSVIKQNPLAERIATFSGSTEISISNLAFDANGKDSFGGVGFYAVKKVRIENNFFWDSNPKPIKGKDRYSIVVGHGGSASQDVRIINNVIEDLQMEVDHSQGVVIDRNTVKRAVQTAGIGIFSIRGNSVAEDYQITNNTVIDPFGAGFAVGIDPPTDRHCIFRRILIANNQLIQSKTNAYGIRIGTGDNSVATTGNVFEDITIRDNSIRVDTAAPRPDPMIFANTSPRAGIVFERLIVTGNTIENDARKNKDYAIDLRRIQHSVVAGNTVRKVTNGISLDGKLLSNEIRDNLVEASDTAYYFGDSLGGNKATNNRLSGKPKAGWKTSGMQTSDALEKPQ
jgi:Pectate lyase superfamily protein/Periplasmic copper-binding protein (NosD)